MTSCLYDHFDGLTLSGDVLVQPLACMKWPCGQRQFTIWEQAKVG